MIYLNNLRGIKMVIINNSRGKTYDYSNKAIDNSLIDKKIRDDFAEMCKKLKITKSKLVEEFYKTLIIRYKEGTLTEVNSYITLNVFKSGRKVKKSNPRS